MTVETVPIIITRSAVSENKQIRVSDLEGELTRITTCTAQEEVVLILEALDAALRWCVPKAWKNVSQELRNLVMEMGYVSFRRRVYLDETGKRRKPVDEMLRLKPYQRNSLRVQELACNMAIDSSYRQAACWLSEMVKTPISTSSIDDSKLEIAIAIEGGALIFTCP